MDNEPDNIYDYELDFDKLLSKDGKWHSVHGLYDRPEYCQ